MAEWFLLSRAQMWWIEPFFRRSRRLLRDDDRRVISGIVCHLPRAAIADSPRGYGLHKMLSNRFLRSRLGGLKRIFAAPVTEEGEPDRLTIDATHLEAHRTSASLLKKGVLCAGLG